MHPDKASLPGRPVNGAPEILEQQADTRGQTEPGPTAIPPASSRPSRAYTWQKLAGAPFFGWLLGLLGLAAYLCWLALPSRLPALGLLGLLAGGATARWYAARTRQGLKLRLRAEYTAL